MLFPGQSLQGDIINCLKEGPKLLTEIVEIIKSKRVGTSKQGVYKAIKKLQSSEILLIHNHLASLNLHWLTELSLFTEMANTKYLNAKNAGNTINLLTGETVTYKFNNAINADLFWNHVLYTLASITSVDDNLYCYNPHSWFWLISKHREAALVDFIKKAGRQYFVIANSKHPGDRCIESLIKTKKFFKYFKQNNAILNDFGLDKIQQENP